jgi:hypothetical protein
VEVQELAPGLWRWTAWHAEYGDEVGCFYAEAGDATLLIDPLVPADDEERFLRALDRDVERRGLPLAVLLTTHDHARSAGELAARYGGEVWGHERARAKVAGAPFRAIEPGDEAPGGVRVVGVPDGGFGATPLHLPAHRALSPGDSLLEVDGVLRIWWGFEGEEDERLFFECWLPEYRRWLDLDLEHVLVSHGQHVPGGHAALAAALALPPWSTDDG